MKRRMRLTESVLPKRSNILRCAHCPPAQVIREGFHKEVQTGLWKNPKDARRQDLIIQLHGFLRVRVFLAMQIIGGMDLTASQALSAIHRIHPADRVIMM